MAQAASSAPSEIEARPLPAHSRGTRPGLLRDLSHRTGPLGPRFREGTSRFASRLATWRYADVVFLVLLTALSVGLRWRTLWTSYWGDEAIAIGIAAQPLHSLPHALVNDGSPPLYYVLLHFWVELFGRSEPATHALSMIPAELAIPAGWWCADRLFGRWAARATACLLATCAYLDYYSTETRMYSWLALAAMMAVTLFIMAYRGDGRRYWAGAVVGMAAVLYLQYYGLYLLGALLLVGVATAAREPRAQRHRHLPAVLLYGLACGAAFAPWVPHFAYQLVHTGAPWAPHPSLGDLFADPFNALASAAWAFVVVAIAVAVLDRQGVANQWLRSGWLRGLVVSVGRASRACLGSSALVLATEIPLLALILAWIGAQAIHSWNPRYLGVVVVPALLPLAGGLAQARRGMLALTATATALAATAIPVLVDRSVTVETSKSDVAYLLGELRSHLRPGDLVVSAQLTDTPVVALELGKGFRYATPLGLQKNPLLVDWSDLPTRLQGINAASSLAPLLAVLPVGAHVLLVNPSSWSRGETPARYAGAVEAEAIAANQAVLDDPALREELTESVPRYSDPLYPMSFTLFVRTAATGQPRLS